MIDVQVAVVGGGPAGLSAALECWRQGLREVLVIERDSMLGGILNQCIHAGFGLHVFGEELTGPEYAQRYVNMVKETGIKALTDTMVTSIEHVRTPDLGVGCSVKTDVPESCIVVRAMNARDGLMDIRAKAVVLAMGCRERTRGMLRIPGTRPAGVYTAGTAQRLVNIEGFMPGREVVILGSGDIGLIMARRMTLEGAHVHGVYEVMPKSNGLRRNIVQCLDDFGIPLHLSMTAVEIHGRDRVTGVTVAKVDGSMNPIPGTEEYVPCDTVLLSVGLIPENELSRKAGIEMDPKTRGPVDKGRFMTSIPGVFACGNVLKVYDLADNVTKDSVLCGQAVASFVGEMQLWRHRL